MEPVTPHDQFYSRVFAIITIALLGFVFYLIITPFIAPIMWAAFLAFLLYPLHKRLTRQLKHRKNTSAFLLTVITFVMLIGPITALSAAFIAQSDDLVQWVQETVIKQNREGYHVLRDVPYIESILKKIHKTTGISTIKLHKWIETSVEQVPQFLSSLGGKIFLGAINTALAFVLMLFMFFFFLRDGTEFIDMMRDLIPMVPARREKLIRHMASVTRSVVFGTGITVLIQGTLIGFAFLITGLGSPLVFGVLAAIMALLPFGGTAFVWLPALFVLAGEGHWDMALVMLITGLIASTVDNVLHPMLISSRGQVGTLAVFVGVLGGTVAFGPIGFVLGPVVLALIIALIRFAHELRQEH